MKGQLHVSVDHFDGYCLLFRCLIPQADRSVYLQSRVHRQARTLTSHPLTLTTTRKSSSLTTHSLLSRLTTPRPPSLDLKLFRSAHTRQLPARRRYMEFANRTVRALSITEYILQERPQKRRKASEETILQKVSSTQVSSQPPSKGNCSITPPPTTTLVHSSPSPGPSKPSPLQITRHSPSSSESDSDGDLPSVEMLLARTFSVPLLMLD